MEFKYKDADFYNAYCEQLEDFILLEYFEDMKENYVGKWGCNLNCVKACSGV